MRYLEEFCRKIDLQEEIADLVLEFDDAFDYSQVETSMDKLFDRDTWKAGREEIKQVIGDDERGIGILACMLRCSIKTYNKYLSMGVDERVLIDTMKCYKRFIDEHMSSYGTYAFDRDFWTARQASGNLFCFGEFEYEFIEESGEKSIAFHIPSKAKLKKEYIKDSYWKFMEFVEKFKQDYIGVKIICESWLLDPCLKKVLPEDSNIIRFQSLFDIVEIDYTLNEVIEWVYQKTDTPYEDLPEETTLQRNLKKFLLQGGRVGEAHGIINESFLK